MAALCLDLDMLANPRPRGHGFSRKYAINPRFQFW